MNKMMSQVAPTEYTFESAKTAIDNAANIKSSYKHSLPERVSANILCVGIGCLPCFMWSALSRIICCPFVCMTAKHVKGNPILALLTDSEVNYKSDECIRLTYNSINQKTNIRRVVPKEHALQVLKYAGEKIESTTDIKAKYAITDVVYPLMRKYSSYATATPKNIVDFSKTIT